MADTPKESKNGLGPESPVFPDEYHPMDKRAKVYQHMATGKFKHYLADGDGNVHTVHLIPAKLIDEKIDENK